MNTPRPFFGMMPNSVATIQANMRFFTDLLSRHLLRRPATSPRRDSAAAAARADAPASYAGAEDEEEVKWDSML